MVKKTKKNTQLDQTLNRALEMGKINLGRESI